MVPKSLGKAWWSIWFFSVRVVTGMRNGSEPIMVKLLKEIVMGISITQGIMYLPPILYPHYLIQFARFLCVNLNYPKRNHI